MREYDVLFIHAPAVWDFRERLIRFGPIADAVPSTPVFDMYPVGFLYLAAYLSARGWRVGILNLAARMVLEPKLDPARLLRSYRARVYAFDLHWAVHCHGVYHATRLVKKLHPDSKVVVGGFTATIYWRELLECCWSVDYVVLGDSTYPVMDALLRVVVEGRGSLEEVPNVAWRGRFSPKSTGVRFAPRVLDEYRLDYEEAFRVVLRSGSPLDSLPYAAFLREPAGGVVLYHGCPRVCATCGGSRYTFTRYLGRDEVGVKSPKAVADEVESIARLMRGISVFLLNDPNTLGRRYVEELARELRERRLDDINLVYEFFLPPPRDVLKLLASTAGRVTFELSPETAVEEVRRRFGKPYPNSAVSRFLRDALVEAGAWRVDLYFMHGLPRQTLEDCLAVPRWVDELYSSLPGWARGRLYAFAAPLAPFIDPGSIAFDRPSDYGYRLKARTLYSHVSLLASARDWTQLLNYESTSLPYEHLERACYEVGKGLAVVQAKHGVIPWELAEETVRRIEEAERGERIGVDLDKETVPRGTLYQAYTVLRHLRLGKLLHPTVAPRLITLALRGARG